MLKPKNSKPHFLVKRGGELSLTSRDIVGLMKGVLGKNVAFRFRARGFSMHPYIEDGDIVTVIPVGEKIPTQDDVVAFIHPVTNKLLLHRIVAKRGSDYLIKGDNTSEIDGYIPETNILGCVKCVEKRRTLSRLFLSNPLYRFLKQCLKTIMKYRTSRG